MSAVLIELGKRIAKSNFSFFISRMVDNRVSEDISLLSAYGLSLNSSQIWGRPSTVMREAGKSPLTPAIAGIASTASPSQFGATTSTLFMFALSFKVWFSTFGASRTIAPDGLLQMTQLYL